MEGGAQPLRYTRPPVKSSVQTLESNKVKVVVEIDEAEFDKDVDAAFKRIAREVRLPGFRPGKAPRRILEARLGAEVGRQEALREALPNYYAKAVVEHDVDVIAAPEIDITSGQESGPVAFDAVVEVRPRIPLAGYRNLRVEIPSPFPDDSEIEAQLDRLREQFAELATVERAVVDGDLVTIDISGTYQDEPLPGLSATDYLFEVGRGAVVPEIDENLRGASAGDRLEFAAPHPDPDEEGELAFVIEVKEVKEKVLPVVDDEFARNASEFSTAAELRDDLEKRMTSLKRAVARNAVRTRVSEELATLVTDEVPDAMVGSEMQGRLEDLVMRLRAQGVGLEQYLQATGRDPDDLREELRDSALQAVKVDLALRAVAEAEAIEVPDDELDTELEPVAAQAKLDVEEVRRRFAESGQLSSVRSSIQKGKALEWLISQVEIVDPNGTVIDPALLDEEDAGDEPAGDAGDGATDGDAAAAGENEESAQ
jgi:trigger factor